MLPTAALSLLNVAEELGKNGAFWKTISSRLKVLTFTTSLNVRSKEPSEVSREKDVSIGLVVSGTTFLACRAFPETIGVRTFGVGAVSLAALEPTFMNVLSIFVPRFSSC